MRNTNLDELRVPPPVSPTNSVGIRFELSLS